MCASDRQTAVAGQDWNLKLKVEARRARGRLLLVLRHLLWRLEAVRCEACWEADAPPHESYFQEPICIIADALRMDDESILLDSSHLVYPVRPLHLFLIR